MCGHGLGEGEEKDHVGKEVGDCFVDRYVGVGRLLCNTTLIKPPFNTVRYSLYENSHFGACDRNRMHYAMRK